MKKLIIIAFIISLLGCIKEECDFPGDYEFVVYGEVTPYDSVYHVGDTLTLSCKYHHMVYEKNTDKYYNLKNISNIEASLWIYNIDTVSPDLDSRVTDFSNIIPDNKYNYYIQTFSSGHVALYSNILIINDTFFNVIKIVFKQKGLYMLSYGPNCIENDSSFEGKCSGKNFNLFTILNQSKDNHIGYLALSPDEHFNNWILNQHPQDNFYERGCFAYRVID